MDSDYFGFIVNSKSTEKEIKSDLVSSGVVFKGTVSEKRFQGYRCESGIANCIKGHLQFFIRGALSPGDFEI